MTAATSRDALQDLDRLFRGGAVAGLGDDRLLGRYIESGDADAFGAIVARHGPRVLREARAGLDRPGDAEDVFQSTFLALARRASAVRSPGALGGWLRRVARREAARANREASRRERRGRAIAAEGSRPAGDPAEREERRRAVLDEVGRLPESQRLPVVLCLLEGLPTPEAAGRLRLSDAAVRGRLDRAKALLRSRLARRGFAPAAVAATTAAEASVPARWVADAVEAARRVAPTAASPAWLKVAATLLAASMAALGAGAVATAPPTAAGSGPLPPTHPRVPVTPTRIDGPRARPAPGPEVVLRGRVLDAEGRPAAGATLTLVPSQLSRALSRATGGPDGSYRLTVDASAFAPSAGDPSPRSLLVGHAPGHGPAWVELKPVEGVSPRTMKTEYVQDIILVEDGPIVGRVVGVSGRPVAGASVSVDSIAAPTGEGWGPILPRLRSGEADMLSLGQGHDGWQGLYSSWTSRAIAPAETDAEGRFRVEGVGRDRMVHLKVHGPGITSLDATVLTRDDASAIADALRRRYPARRLPDGLPAQSKADPDTAVVALGNSLYGPEPTIVAQPGRTVAGRVRDAKTGAPIADARVVLRSSGDSGYGDGTGPDAAGRYRRQRSGADPTVWVTAWFYDTQKYLTALRRVDGVGGLGEAVVDIDMVPGVVAAGQVVEAGTDRPIVSAPKDECGRPGALMAGVITYLPLATNLALKGTPTGDAFLGGLDGGHQPQALIGGDGRYRIVVPPGPGLLLVEARPGLPMFAAFSPWTEKEGYHRLFPYAKLDARRPGDGAPPAEGLDPMTLTGLAGPIDLRRYHAYRYINPAADAETIRVDLSVPRAASRRVRFVEPGGAPIRGVTVHGLLAPPGPSVVLDGDEAEVSALDARTPRRVRAISIDGRFYGEASITPGVEPMAFAMGRAATIAGRLVDEATGRPRPGRRVEARVLDPDQAGGLPLSVPAALTDGQGRFRLAGIIPGLHVQLTFHPGPKDGPDFGTAPIDRPAKARDLSLDPGEDRDLGDLPSTPRRP